MPTSYNKISCIVPVKNGIPYLEDCLASLLKQDFVGPFEVCIYNDGSTDDTADVISRYQRLFGEKGIGFQQDGSTSSGGVGFAKNRAIDLSSGQFLCFCDADDVSRPERLRTLYDKGIVEDKEVTSRLFFGSNFSRLPEDSTVRYTRWGNSLQDDLIKIQIYTSHGPTLLAPTWFLSRDLYDKVGGFAEEQKTGFPEDLDFFYKALDAGAFMRKVAVDLVIYRYHSGCASFGVNESSIWNLRIEHLERNVIQAWDHFTIWSVGKQGKRFYKSLSPASKAKVIAFCDVDAKKIKHGKYEEYDEKTRKVVNSVPVIHVKCARPPVVICVKLDMTNGSLEELIADHGWQEGKDYVHFS